MQPPVGACVPPPHMDAPDEHRLHASCAVTAMEEACLDRLLTDRHHHCPSPSSSGLSPTGGGDARRGGACWWAAAMPVLSWLQRVDGLLFQTGAVTPRLTRWGAAMLCRILEALFLDAGAGGGGGGAAAAAALLPPGLTDWLQNRLVPTILGQPPSAYAAVAIPPLWPLDPVQQALVTLLLRLLAPTVSLSPSEQTSASSTSSTSSACCCPTSAATTPFFAE